MPLNAVMITGVTNVHLSALRVHLSEAGIKNPLVSFVDGVDLINFLRNFEERRDGNGRPCMLVLDVDLPSVNGFEILRWLREKSNFKDLPAIILSDSVEPKDVKRAAAFGVREYKAKNSSPAVLAKAIAKAVREG